MARPQFHTRQSRPGESRTRVFRLVEQLRLLRKLTDAIARATDLSDVYEQALSGLEQALGVERSAVLLLDHENVMRFVAWRGVSRAYREAVEGHGPWPADVTDLQPVLAPDVFDAPELASLRPAFEAEHIRAVGFIPLVSKDRLLGKFMIYFREPHSFRADEVAVAQTIGQLVAFAVERKATEEQLKETDRRKDEFLATLAHELRNPLASILMGVELQASHECDGDFERSRCIVERQARHLARLVDDLMDVSRITRGLVELCMKRIELAAVVGQAVEQVTPAIRRAGHDLVVSVPDGIRLDADPSRLSQILVNLLDNAVKYTPPGGRITLEAERDESDIVIRVRDTGMGISEELIPVLFDVFRRGEGPLVPGAGGLGIGLTVTKKLVELHGGSITASSAGVGQGSEFVVRLPAVTEPRTKDEPRSDLEERVPSGRVLVVDDNEDAAELLGARLTRWGCEVAVAYDGAQALEVAREFHPDVALLDVGLPDMDGYEVARRLRELPELAHLGLIALTGYGLERDVRQSREAGISHHLVKPVSSETLAEALATVQANRAA